MKNNLTNFRPHELTLYEKCIELLKLSSLTIVKNGKDYSLIDAEYGIDRSDFWELFRELKVTV